MGWNEGIGCSMVGEMRCPMNLYCDRLNICAWCLSPGFDPKIYFCFQDRKVIHGHLLGRESLAQ